MSQKISNKPKTLEEIITVEKETVKAKRQNYHPEELGEPPFGIALSGGGIRSATLNLGVLEVLNACGILKRADYLSTVSGGGYIGGYVHAHLSQGGPKAYEQMFEPDEIKKLKSYGYYLTPGNKRLKRFFSRLRMSGALVISFLLNWIWVLALAGVLIFLLKFLMYWFFSSLQQVPWVLDNLKYAEYALIGAAIFILVYYFFGHGLRRIYLWNSDHLYYAAGFLLLIVICWVCLHLAKTIQVPDVELSPQWLFNPLRLLSAAWRPDSSGGSGLLLSSVILLVTGFFANPNLLTLHRFYRDRLRKAYLQAAGTGDEGLKLFEIVSGNKYCGPYPLINTCLNLFNAQDNRFVGTKGTDYFLLSPGFCGSELLGYEETESLLYKTMTLATAVAVSGAAINPHMGTQSNRLVAFLLTLFNLRLGYWAYKPKASSNFRWLTWWPYYHILELLSLNDTSRRRVNLSDGGHIENLGVFELLRRGCPLIIAVDATADPKYAFNDLKNLVIRARNELGLAIDFQQEPESFIRPLPSRGFSRSHFVRASITDLPEKSSVLYKKENPGLLIFLKASMLEDTHARKSQKDKKSKSAFYAYATYHPDFPHESTANQFFDKHQWEAYYQLGRLMAANLLGIEITADESTVNGECKINSLVELRKILENRSVMSG